jgi:proprotein convertase subtilisin/kexin type 5
MGVCCNTSLAFYRDFSGASPSCLPCHAFCKTCHGPNQDHCFSCNPGANFNTVTGACDCPSDYYMNPFGICTLCPQGCLTCTSDINCTSCRVNFLPVVLTGPARNLCECPTTTSYFQIDNTTSIHTCNPCPQGCSRCNNGTAPLTCTACDAGFLLTSGACPCPAIGYWLNTAPTRHTCTICTAGCTTCLNLTQCSICAGTLI